MAIPILDKLQWLSGYMTHAAIAQELGVSRPTVTRYLSGERTIPVARFEEISKLYNRTQYRVMTEEGLAPEAAAKYRGLSPETFETWHESLTDIKEKYTGGHVAARLYREGLDITEMTPDELQRIWDEEYARLEDELYESGDDIEEFETSP